MKKRTKVESSTNEEKLISWLIKNFYLPEDAKSSENSEIFSKLPIQKLLTKPIQDTLNKPQPWSTREKSRLAAIGSTLKKKWAMLVAASKRPKVSPLVLLKAKVHSKCGRIDEDIVDLMDTQKITKKELAYRVNRVIGLLSITKTEAPHIIKILKNHWFDEWKEALIVLGKRKTGLSKHDLCLYEAYSPMGIDKMKILQSYSELVISKIEEITK